jgi:hypothetical protein
MFDIKQLEVEIATLKDYKTIAQEMNVSKTFLHKLFQEYDIAITYAKHQLRRELVEYLQRNTFEKMAKDIPLDPKIIMNMKKGIEITYRALIKMLEFYDVPYSLKLVQRENLGTTEFRRFLIDFPRKHEYDLPSVEEVKFKDRRSEKLYAHLVSSHFAKLEKIMKEQHIGTITQNRIKEIFNDTIRESINLGTVVERNKDKGIVDKLSAAIKNGKVLQVNEDVL